MLKQAEHLTSYNASYMLEIHAYRSTELVLSTWVFSPRTQNLKKQSYIISLAVPESRNTKKKKEITQIKLIVCKKSLQDIYIVFKSLTDLKVVWSLAETPITNSARAL